jgi:hypothetical protein
MLVNHRTNSLMDSFFLQCSAPRRGRPPKKLVPASPVVVAPSGGDLAELAHQAVVAVAESVKAEPSQTAANMANVVADSVPSSGGALALSPIDKQFASLERQLATISGDVCTEQTIIVGGGAGDGGTLALNAAPGTVYVFHPLVDDAGQRFALQTLKQFLERSEVENDPTAVAASGCSSVLLNAAASDVLNGAADLTGLLCASGTTDIKQTTAADAVPDVTS